MHLKLCQNEIQQAIRDYVFSKTKFIVADSDVIIIADYTGSYGEQEVSGFHAEIQLTIKDSAVDL